MIILPNKKELDIYKEHISAIRNICDAALKDWKEEDN